MRDFLTLTVSILLFATSLHAQEVSVVNNKSSDIRALVAKVDSLKGLIETAVNTANEAKEEALEAQNEAEKAKEDAEKADEKAVQAQADADILKAKNDSLQAELDKLNNCNAQGKLLNINGECVDPKDARIGSLVNGKHCAYSSTFKKIQCTNSPAVVEKPMDFDTTAIDNSIKTLVANDTLLNQNINKIAVCNAQGRFLNSKSQCVDPKDNRIGSLSSGKYCTYSSGKINCRSTVSTGGSSGGDTGGSTGGGSYSKGWKMVYAGGGSSYQISGSYDFAYAVMGYNYASCQSSNPNHCTKESNASFSAGSAKTGNVTTGNSISKSSTFNNTATIQNSYGSPNRTLKANCGTRTISISSSGKVSLSSTTPCYKGDGGVGNTGSTVSVGAGVKDLKIKEVWVYR